MKIVKACLLSTLVATGAFISSTVNADVTRECILTGHINDTSSDQIRVTFRDITAGDNAPCRMKRGKARASIRFKASELDQIRSLPEGAEITYRYQRRNGKDEWLLLTSES